MEFIRQGLAPVTGLWGYAEADSTIVGIVVAAVAVLAVVYVVGRLRRGRNTGPGDRSGKNQGWRG